MAEQSYIEQREGTYPVAGTRVSLDSISMPSSKANRGKYPAILPGLNLGAGLRCDYVYLAYREVLRPTCGSKQQRLRR